ncbi:Uncharacterized protein Adt_00907 [Abeliophyllum distichum]|uniref:Uncharacterized protein n=1 Tax=Abeliophyllum distichum TaxID=126358 RepID=A0ABD1VRF3_9LAMI
MTLQNPRHHILVESIFCPSDKHGNSDYMTQRSRERFDGLSKKERSSTYENGTVEPCYYNSSIYYGAQQIYSPANQNIIPQHNTFNKDGDCASRGNWWKGSLYY